MSYLLDALNKSGGENQPNNQSNNTSNNASNNQTSHQASYQPDHQQFMYQQAAFGQQDEGINVYKWISIVLALVLTLIFGFVLGNKFSILSAFSTAPEVITQQPIATQTPITAAPAVQAPVTQAPVVTAKAQPAVQATQSQPITTQSTVAMATAANVQVNPQSTPKTVNQTQPTNQTSDKQLALSGDKDTGISNISSDLLKKFSAAVKQSESIALTDEIEEQKLLLKGDERIEQYFSHVATIEELTPALKADIPNLSYNTHIYATDPRQRWVKINGNTLQEEQWVNDDIQVIEIQQQMVILELHHTRFSVTALTDWEG